MLEPAPDALVADGRQRFGRFGGPTRANLIDTKWLVRPLRKLRLKEWQALQVTTPSLFINVALFDVKLMQLVQVKIYDRAKQQKHLVEHKLRPGAFKLADQILDSTNSHGGLAFRNRLASGRIEVTLDMPEITGQLVVHTDRGASQVVSLPFEGDVGMYSHKGMFPVDGHLQFGGQRHEIDGLGLLDDHKGFYPYVMKWDWVTAASRDGGHARGFNLTRNQCREPDRFNENCVWIDDRIATLPAVTFEREHARQPGERWRIRDAHGRVDIEFEPTVPGDLKLNALVIESRYRGPFGTFTGKLAPEGIDPIRVDGWFGMGEEFYLRC